jgi:small subunit ribosomal protein S4e|tara:strand:+ start:3409 stop:3993 length:585 start_codon:yes stop_codon:yes gene_type:complete
MPLGIILRDVLGLAHSKREAKRMVSTRKVMVDGRIETDVGRGVGIMDVLTVGDDHYRCLLDENGKLRYRSIPAKDSSSKLCRVMGKTTIRGGKTQVHLHDGRNITVDEAKKYNSGDTLVVSLPDQEVSGHHAFSEGVLAYLTGGSHIGSTAKVVSKDVKRSSKANEVQFEEFGTVADYVFVIGSEKDLPLEAEA